MGSSLIQVINGLEEHPQDKIEVVISWGDKEVRDELRYDRGNIKKAFNNGYGQVTADVSYWRMSDITIEVIWHEQKKKVQFKHDTSDHFWKRPGRTSPYTFVKDVWNLVDMKKDPNPGNLFVHYVYSDGVYIGAEPGAWFFGILGKANENRRIVPWEKINDDN